MQPQPQPLPEGSAPKISTPREKGLASRSGLARVFGFPSARETQQQAASDSNWALKLKQVSEAAAKELQVEIVSARLIHLYEDTDRDAALFELESERGKIQAILSRAGTYSFFWKR